MPIKTGRQTAFHQEKKKREKWVKGEADDRLSFFLANCLNGSVPFFFLQHICYREKSSDAAEYRVSVPVCCLTSLSLQDSVRNAADQALIPQRTVCFSG